MESSGLRRHRVHLAVLLGVLVLLASAERRLAYLDFNWAGAVRIEDNEKPDGDEILNKLTFVADATEPTAPVVGDVCQRQALAFDSDLHAVVTLRLGDSRAPPYVRSLSA